MKKKITKIVEDYLEKEGNFNTDFLVAYIVDRTCVEIISILEDSRNISEAIKKIEKAQDL